MTNFHESCYSFESFKEWIVHFCMVFRLVKLMIPSLRFLHLMFKGKSCWDFTPAVKNNFSCQLILSQSYGYIILKILKLCSEFHAVDVGFIMTLYRWDYSRKHKLIIQELVLETSLVPWDLYALMMDSLALDIGSHHWPLIERFNRVFDIKSSIHT